MPNIIERELRQAIFEELNSDKIILVVGPRQSGKTTLLEGISKELITKNEQVYFYNFDRVADLDFFNKQNKVEAFLKIRSIKSRLYVFIDEVQRKKDAGNFFKYFYDAKLNVKFVFSGSSSVELTDAFGDALTGRKRIFHLLPLSIAEVAKSTLGEEWDFASQGEPFALDKLANIIQQHMIWGTYPEVTGKKSENAKLKALGELYESYVQKDVKDLLRVKNISGFNLLVKVLAHNIGNPIVVEDLVRQTNLHTATVNSYLDILEGTMIIARTANYNPTFTDKLPKSQRYYFIDNGIRNYALSQLHDNFRSDIRQLAANLLYSELLKRSEVESSYLTTDEPGGGNMNQDTTDPTPKKIDLFGASIHHYQTYSDNHIDFIIKPKTSDRIIPIVVHYDDSGKLGKKVHEYLNNNKPGEIYIITKDLNKTEDIKACQVNFVTLAEFIARLQ